MCAQPLVTRVSGGAELTVRASDARRIRRLSRRNRRAKFVFEAIEILG
jgi:hypothetical protein